MNPICGHDGAIGLLSYGLTFLASTVEAVRRGQWRVFVPCFLTGFLVWGFFTVVGFLMIPFAVVSIPFGFALAVKEFLKAHRSIHEQGPSGDEYVHRVEGRLVQVDVTVRHLHELPQSVPRPVSPQRIALKLPPDGAISSVIVGNPANR
jgi:hypothetical protein